MAGDRSDAYWLTTRDIIDPSLFIVNNRHPSRRLLNASAICQDGIDGGYPVDEKYRSCRFTQARCQDFSS